MLRGNGGGIIYEEKRKCLLKVDEQILLLVTA